MQALIFILFLASFAISAPLCWFVRTLSIKLGAIDSDAIEGQVKDQHRSIPNTGGIAIFSGIIIPLTVGLVFFNTVSADQLPSFLEPIAQHIPGIQQQLPMAWLFVLCVLALHVLGVIDDRKPIGPMIKLIIMLIPGALFAIFFDTRLVTLLDQYVGGTWLSMIITIVWFGVVINAMNFLDNMDGLSSGISVITSSFFLIAALLNGQWFIAALLALLVGACFAFLLFNFPPAKLFMGDGGSLVIGFLLAFTTVRTTYISADTNIHSQGAWYPVLMPIVILAVPLYDFTTVTLIRLSQGKSPFVGDLQHFSHRIRNRGLGPRSTIGVIYALTLTTGISGLALSQATPFIALMLGIQIFALLSMIALFELRSPTLSSEGNSEHE